MAAREVRGDVLEGAKMHPWIVHDMGV
jgi:hypothetical protein